MKSQTLQALRESFKRAQRLIYQSIRMRCELTCHWNVRHKILWFDKRIIYVRTLIDVFVICQNKKVIANFNPIAKFSLFCFPKKKTLRTPHNGSFNQQKTSPAYNYCRSTPQIKWDECTVQWNCASFKMSRCHRRLIVKLHKNKHSGWQFVICIHIFWFFHAYNVF